jgi:uncharacterized RDD family membrane protein YckC
MSETVTLLNIAPKSRRMLTRFIDCSLFIAGAIAVLLWWPTPTDAASDRNGAYMFWFMALGFPLFYYWFCEAVFGKTLGKVLTRTTVLRFDGTKPLGSKILLRALCRYIPFNYSSIHFNGYLSWHDKLSGTYVANDQ